MLYVTELHACEYSREWPHDRVSEMFADTHAELWSARRYFAIRPNWVKAEGEATEHFDLTPKKYDRIVREWLHREKVEVVTMARAAAIIKQKKRDGIV